MMCQRFLQVAALCIDFFTAGGGASFSTLETITGISGMPSGSRRYDISAYAAADMQVRIGIGADANIPGCCYENNEAFQVDNLQIESCIAASTLDHFAIDIGSGNASTCVPQEIKYH